MSEHTHREREIGTEAQTQTQTDRQTDRQTDTEVDTGIDLGISGHISHVPFENWGYDSIPIENIYLQLSP